jgi:hypothetical protein
MEWTIYDKTGLTKKAEIKELEYNGEFMGESYVSFSVKSFSPIAFEMGDKLTYRGEEYTLNYDPTVVKKAARYKSGEGFVYDNVKFNSASDELTRCDFLDYVKGDNKVHFTSLPNFDFYASSVRDLADRIQANLDRLYTGTQQWTVVVSSDSEGKKNVPVSISNINVWGALELVNTTFEMNFIIRGRTITIGTEGVAVEGMFSYGKGNGLYQIERNAEQDQAIITRLRAYGSTRNMPVRYYNEIHYVTGSVYVVASYSDNLASNNFYWVKLNLAYTKQRFDETVDFQVNNIWYEGHWEYHSQSYGEVEAGYSMKVYTQRSGLFRNEDKIQNFKDGVHYAAFPSWAVEVPLIPAQQVVQNLMLPGFSFEENDVYVDSDNLSELGIREGTVFFDGSTDGLDEIYPSIEGMTADDLNEAGIPVTVVAGDNGNLDEIADADQVEDDGFWTDKADGESIPPFKAVLKNIGFDIREYWYDGMQPVLSMRDGQLGGREFNIINVEEGTAGGGVKTYILTLERVEDSDLGMYFPNKDYNMKPGDKFVILDIEMPDVYIKAASQRLLRAAKEYLAKNDYVRYTYSPKVDEIYMARQHDKAMASGGAVKSLHDTLKEGDLLSFKDMDLSVEKSIVIDKLTIKEGDIIPTYEITLREDKTVGTIQRMQNQIDSIISGKDKSVGSNGAYRSQLVFDSYISFPTIGRQDTLYVARDRNYTTYAWTGNNYEMTTASVSEDELASKMNKVTILCGY